MQAIYELVQESTEFYTWVFFIVTTLSLVFSYFNKKTHDRELKELEQKLRFDVDRRLRIFDLKATEYSRYVTHLDELRKRNQTELLERMQPIVDQYMSSYLKAAEAGDKESEIAAITLLGSQFASVIRDVVDRYQERALVLGVELGKLNLVSKEF